MIQFYLILLINTVMDIIKSVFLRNISVYENVKSVAEKHAPFVTQRISGHVEAWVTENLIIVRERDFLCKKARKTKSILDWEAFKQKRNHVNRLKIDSKMSTIMSFYSNNKTGLNNFGKP